ncbi:MAG: energy transducer TonB [Deltaproteobacteria bacterium]|nr:energy transducer TonB [Deltaproteobacteria bacterium]
MLDNTSSEWGESELSSLFRSRFLFSSLLFHALLFYVALHAGSLALPKAENNPPISVQLMEVRSGLDTKSIGPGQGAGGPRTMPKLGVPIPPAERVGKIDSGSVETNVPAPTTNNVEAVPPPKPVALPGPKVLALDTRREAINSKETSADSLVRLPTKESATHLPANAAADLDAHQRSLAALKGGSDNVGIKALKEGGQIPGALAGSGTGAGPFGVPGGSRSGTGIVGGGTGTGTGGGGATGLKGIPAADYGNYLNQLKKRVESAWKYPDNISGVQKVAIRFILDRAGKLTLSEVLESSDTRLNASALDAIRRASPFPAIPDSLKDLANEPMIIRFEVAIRVRG